jgi:acetyltransferase-like isoleucine patch superfamily enzyme
MIKGDDVFIDDHVKITRPQLVKIGNHVAIDWGFYCTTQLTVGDYVHISPYVTVIGGAPSLLTVGDFCFISAGARLVCGTDLMQGEGLIGPVVPTKYKDQLDLSPITMKPFSGVATNSIVMPGVTLAEGSVLGANSLLKQDTEPWTIYAGSPAKPIKSRRSDIMKSHARELGYDYK